MTIILFIPSVQSQQYYRTRRIRGNKQKSVFWFLVQFTPTHTKQAYNYTLWVVQSTRFPMIFSAKLPMPFLRHLARCLRCQSSHAIDRRHANCMHVARMRSRSHNRAFDTKVNILHSPECCTHGSLVLDKTQLRCTPHSVWGWACKTARAFAPFSDTVAPICTSALPSSSPTNCTKSTRVHHRSCSLSPLFHIVVGSSLSL